MAIVFSNNARTTLASNISNSATTITVADGSVFPSLTGGDIFYCTIDDGTNNEIVEVTAISSNTLTVVRGQDNTTARAFVSGDLIELRLVAKVLETFPQVDAGEVTADEFIGDLRGAVIFKAQAGEAVSKGDAVYVSGISGNTPVVALADADFTSKMPAFGLVLTAASTNGSTEVVTFGTISGVDTSSFSVGDTLYVSTTAGELTNSKPTGEASLLQNIGKVQRSHATSGAIKVGGAGRTNDTPNLNDGNIFIGNASNQATTASLNTKIEDYLDANGTTFPDNIKAQFGTGNDLQIYHTGNHSYITDTGTGNLYIRADSLDLRRYANGEQYLTGDINGAVTLFYDGVAKIATTSTGIDVTGSVVSDGLTVAGNTTFNTGDVLFTGASANILFDQSANALEFADNAKAQFGTGNDLQIYHNGSNSYIDDAGTGNLFIRSNEIRLNKYTGEFMLRAIADGAVTLYHDNSPKLATTSTGIDVTGTVTADSGTIDGTFIVDGGTGVNSTAVLHVRQDGNGDGNGIAITSSNATSHRIWKNASGVLNIGSSTNSNAFQQDLTGNVTIEGTISSGSITTSGDVNINTANDGLYFSGGNNRIYFNNYRALEGATDGSNLQLGEGYSTTTAYTNFNISSGHNYQVNGTTVIDSSRNLTNIGTISSGAITSTGNITLAEYLYHSGDTDTNLRFQTDRATLTSGGGASVDAHSNGNLYLTGTTVQVYGNYSSTGTISSSDITSSGNLYTSGYVTIDSTTDGKLRLMTPSGESSDWNYIEFYGADDTRDGYVGTDRDGDMKFFSDKNSSELRLESTGATISANLTVTGDLTVNGTTTTVNQTNLDVSDNLIGLNRGASSNANDSGILIERGSTGDNVFIGWDESTDKITFATTTNVPSDTGNLTLTAAPIQASSVGVTNIVTNKVVKYNGSILDDSMITDNGTSVGIDQPSPSSTYKLDVNGSVRSSSASPNFTLQETDSSNQTWALGSYAGTAAIRDITGGTYPLQILTGSPTNSVRIESTKVVISSALESSGTISYNPDVGGDLTLGNDGTYGTHTNGRYITLGFGGTTNGYNRIFAGNTADAPLFINSATGRGIYFRTNGGSADSVIIDTTAGIRSRGQVRATGWYGSQSSDNNGLAAEIGVSGSNAYLLSYNRTSSAYGALRLEGAGITFDPRGSTFTITNSSYVQSNSDIRAAESRVRIGNPSTLSGRSGIRIDTTGDAAADVLFGDNTGSTGWSNVNWALSSRATNENQTFRIYRGSGQPSPYNSEAVAVEIARDLNMTLGKGLVLGSSSTLSIPSHSGIEIDITGSTAGNIRANNDLYILSQTGTLNLGAGGTNSQISLATGGDATFAGNVIISRANPVLILNDTTASSNADQVAYISFQDNGSEEAWVGWGSSGNTDLTIKNNIGSVVLDGTGTTVINDNLDLNGNADISGTLTAAGDITANSGFVKISGSSASEGGELQLLRGTSGTTDINIDNYQNYLRVHSGGSVWATIDSGGISSNSFQINGTTVIDSSSNITASGTVNTNSLVRSNSRVASSHQYPPGHYSKGDQVFAIDPTWSQNELQSFFNSTNVTWSAQSDAPGGYAVYVDGAVSVGGVYGSGFGHIPIETGDLFYMECWVKNVGTVTHYMGSNEFNEGFTSVGGNPGSFGYWVMSNTNPGTSWVKVSGYISNVSGTGTTTGQFDNGAKYWTPMALFNYTNSSGTRACYISGWKVYRVNRGSPLWITQSNRQDVTDAGTITGYSGSVGSTWTPMVLADNNTKPGHPLVIKNSRSDYWSVGLDTHSYGIYARAHSANTRSILQGTDTAGNVVFDAGFDGDLAIGGDISMAGLYAGTWGPSSSSSVGRIGQVTDRVTGSITNQIGGSTSAKWEIVDYGWTAVLMQCDNSGNTYIGGSLGIGVTPDTSHSLKISSNDNEPLEIYSSAGGCWINTQSSGSQVMSMGVDSSGWAIYDRTNSAYRIRVANNGQLQTYQGIANSSSYSQTGGSFSTAGATEVRLTDGTERVRIQGYDLLGYGAGGNGLWVISNVTANASNQTTLTLGTEWDWDDSISFKYVPASSGNQGGVLTIGQDQKNSTSWNHDTTNFNFLGSTIFQFSNTSRLEMRPTSSSGGERVYYAAGSYTANTSATFQDIRMVGTIPVDHKYVRDSSGSYGYKMEYWWDGNSYQSIRQQNDAFRFSVDVIAFDTSDKRLKNNIKPIENCLDKVSKLGAYEFEWDETKQRRFKGFDTGVIAQEVEEVYPHMVETREDGYKALQYEKLVPLLLGAIKEQQEQIESLKSEVDNLKGEK